MADDTFYITTPIYYATDRPHIGHTYTTVAGDAAARYRRLCGREVLYLTGTDEHGQKMERQAAAMGMTPAALADRTSPRYLELWQRLGITNDDFIRTTEPRHHAAVQEIWERMATRGDIYQGDYEGPYCVACESFYSDKDLVDGKCPDHGTVPEVVRESGYFFRLSVYQDRLLAHYEAHPEFVRPESRLNEVVSFVKSGLRDLSISRATVRWGWPVPKAPDQVIYVWVDALTNYLTGTGWPTDAARFERWWPADVHLVGKDILRQHAVYWPAFLMAAGLPLPRQIFSHGWWLRDGKKSSKSGGAIQVEPLIDRFGPDALRYFLLREIPFGLDGNYSDEAFVRRYNSDLANDLGNLTQRSLQMIRNYTDGRVPDGRAGAPTELVQLATEAVAGYRAQFDELAFTRALDSAWELVRAGNRYIDEQAPWKLAKDPDQRAQLEVVLYATAELVRIAWTCLWPVMPDKAEAARAALGVTPRPASADELDWGRLAAGSVLGEFAALFPRVDEKQWLASIRQSTTEAASPGPEPNATTAATTTATSAATTTATATSANDPRTSSSAADKAQPVAQPTATQPGELLTIDDFFRTQLKVGRVISAEPVKKSKKLLKLQVDLGEQVPRQIVAGIAGAYQPDDLVGKNVVIVANLQPAKLMGIESQGMLLAATVDGQPVVATFDQGVVPGTRVQ